MSLITTLKGSQQVLCKSQDMIYFQGMSLSPALKRKASYEHLLYQPRYPA
jgi:hypothetical protein